MNLFNDIYRGKRVFITGHTGFKGSWLALWLTTLGAEVVGFSKDIPTQPSHWELLRLNISSVTGDITKLESIAEAVETHRPDIVFHMAAQAIVRESYLDPVGTFATNVIGTVHVLESCRKDGNVKAIVNTTSDKCYQNNEWDRGYTEDDAMGGNDPYSASKGAAEIAANAYRKSFFNAVEYGKSHKTLLADVRAGNVIGGGDWAKDRLIPDIVRAASNGETVIIRSPHATRPWQHVLEPLSGYLHLGWKLLEGKKEYSDNWNFGPLDESHLSVQEVVEHAKVHWNAINYSIQENTDNFHEAKILKLDSTKARTELRWQSIWDGNTAFEKTIQWYRKYYQSGAIISADDLDAYVQHAHEAGVEWAMT